MIIVHSVNLGFKNRRVAVLKYILAYSVYVKCKNIYIYFWLTHMYGRKKNKSVPWIQPATCFVESGSRSNYCSFLLYMVSKYSLF